MLNYNHVNELAVFLESMQIKYNLSPSQMYLLLLNAMSHSVQIDIMEEMKNAK